MATILEEDFNSYNDGALEGQGGWSVRSGYAGQIKIQGTTVKEGAKAANGQGTLDSDVIKTGSQVSDGRITYYGRIGTASKRGATLVLCEGIQTRIQIGFQPNNYIGYYNGSGWQYIAPYVVDKWYCIEIEWRSSDKKARYRVDGGTWTDWDTTQIAFTNYLDSVCVTNNASDPVVQQYHDHIAENPIPTTTYTKTFDADTLFKKLGITETLDADTLLKKLGILQTVDVDALLQKGFTRTFLAKVLLGAANITELTADVLFKAFGLTQTLDVDALLQQQDITETVDVDAIIKLIATQSIDADALLRAALSQTLDADALFLKEGLTKTAHIDALFLKSVTQAILADLLLQKALTQGVDVDALLRGALTKTFTADVRLGEMGVTVFTASVYFKRLPYHVILDAQYITETPEANRVYVIGSDAEGNPVYGTSHNQDEIDLAGERLDFTLALSIPTSSLAADVADAMLKKHRLTKHRGFITIPPNAGAELWDVIQVTDTPCAQSSSNYRVVAIGFDYHPRQHRYQHKLFLAAR